MMGMSYELRLEQRLVFIPHTPLRNPEITKEARGIEGNLDKALSKGPIRRHDKILNTEAFLLSQWEAGEQWEKYLDSPLIAHVDAALKLRENYDAVVGIREAGIPYAKIFEMVGFAVFDIDYSHHKRDMKEPIMDVGQIKQLRDKQAVLVIDIDFVTGKTLREVTRYLRENGVNVKGAYIGLFRWHGIESEEPYLVGVDTVNFNLFWQNSLKSGLSSVRGTPYKKYKKLIPPDFELYTSNPALEENELRGSAAARRVAKYFKERQR